MRAYDMKYWVLMYELCRSHKLSSSVEAEECLCLQTCKEAIPFCSSMIIPLITSHVFALKTVSVKLGQNVLVL